MNGWRLRMGAALVVLALAAVGGRARAQEKAPEREQEKATLVVASAPSGAEVHLDGKLLGRTPLEAQVEVPEDGRNIEFHVVLLDHAPARRVARLRPGAQTRVARVNLREQAWCPLRFEGVDSAGWEIRAVGGYASTVVDPPHVAALAPGTSVLSLVRAGWLLPPIEIESEVGREIVLDLSDWERPLPRLDLSEEPGAGDLRLDGRPVADGAVVPPGEHRWQRAARGAVETVHVEAGPWLRPPRRYAPREPLDLALAWLASHQSPDGRWDADGFGSDCGCSGRGGAAHDVGVSALALQALLVGGSTQHGGPHREAVKRGLDYLLSVQDESGMIGPREGRSFSYGHALASIALFEAYGRTGDVALRGPCRRAADAIAALKNPYLAWRYGVRDGDNDTSVTVWMVCAAHAATQVGLRLDPEVLVGPASWLLKLTAPDTGHTGYQRRGFDSADRLRPDFRGVREKEPEGYPEPVEDSLPLTAGACVARVLIDDALAALDARPHWMSGPAGQVPEIHERALAEVADQWTSVPVPRGGVTDLGFLYFGARALRGGGVSGRGLWRDNLRELPAALQDTSDAHTRGSFAPKCRWGREGGRVYATALAALTLEIAYREP